MNNVTYHCRRGGDWDLAAEEWAVDEYGVDPFILFVLRAVLTGRARCSGCHRVFEATEELALITVLIGGVPLRVCQEAYCLPCTELQADAIADLSGGGRRGRCGAEPPDIFGDVAPGPRKRLGARTPFTKLRRET